MDTDTGLRIGAAVWVVLMAGVALMLSPWLGAAVFVGAGAALAMHARRG